MKFVEIISDSEPKKINWDKPQYVQEISNPHRIVLTIGGHSVDHFKGVALPNKSDKGGHFSSGWLKHSFKLFTGTATLHIKND